MANVTLSDKLRPITQEINLNIKDRVIDPKQSGIVSAGIVSVEFVDDVTFATVINDEPQGELYVVDDDEALAPTKLPGRTVQEHKEREFGRFVTIEHSHINKLLGKVVGNSKSYYQSQSYQDVKDRLVNLGRGTLARQAAFKIASYVYGALTGQIVNMRRSGVAENIDLSITDGGSVLTSWALSNTDIIADMLAIETALLGLSEPSSIAAGHTITSRKVVQNILKNEKVKALFNNTTALSQIPSNAALGQRSINGIYAGGALDEYFGQIVETNETWKNESGTSTRYLDPDYLIVTPDTQLKNNPIVKVYIAPTSLDPKYVNSDSNTGFSTHERDGLEAQDEESQKVGSYTIGIRGKIAVWVRNPQRIYKKKVIV